MSWSANNESKSSSAGTAHWKYRVSATSPSLECQSQSSICSAVSGRTASYAVRSSRIDRWKPCNASGRTMDRFQSPIAGK